MNILSDFIEKNFFPGFRISNIVISDDKSKEMTIYLEPKSAPVCPHCKSHNVVVHEYRQRTVRDEKILGYLVTLVLTYRTIRCNHCTHKFSTENIDFLSDSFRVTKRCENAVIEDLEKAGSIKDTAERMGLSWDTCKNMDHP